VRTAFPDAPISVDTYKAGVARAAVRAGADMVNDVWRGFGDTLPHLASTRVFGDTMPKPGSTGILARETPAADLSNTQRGQRCPRSQAEPPPMARVVAELRCPIILMHNRPAPDYTDFWPDVLADLQMSVSAMRSAGVDAGQIWTDPGFGFAKDVAQNLETLKNLSRIVALGYPVLLGTSRKSTIGRVLKKQVPADREDGTAATLVWGIQQGARMVRVHDVAAMRPFVQMADAIRAGITWKERTDQHI
jgi:dihydropteroate synthase